MAVPNLTREQAAILGLYTGVTCGPMADIEAYASKLVGEPGIPPVAMAMMRARLKELAAPDFKALCFDGK